MTSLPRGIIILLAVVLCSATATATLDVEEKQKEERARESTKKLKIEDVADGTPEKPQNFLVISQSSDSIMEVWDKPADGDDVHYFVYVENEDMNDTTSLFYYTWEGLEACTSYTLGVRAVTSKGDMSEPALQEGQTLVGIPPEPQDLHVEKYTHTTVTLAWKEPDTLCHIEHYRVKYKYEGSMPQDIQVSETTVEVSDLLPNTTYTFSVYASTTEGEGLAATMEQTTALDPPGPPENLVAEGISSTAINVSWSAPTATPSYYIVTSVPCMYDEKVVYDLTYLIEGLKPCQLCYITVNSYYKDNDSKFSAKTSATPSIEAPPPPINCVVEVKEQYIAVSWEKPSTPCVLGTYNVSWTWKQLWGNGEEESDTLDTPALSQTVYKPPPYHLYTFKIAASIDGTFGSPTSCSGTSLESPAGPPVLVSVESGEQGMAQVTWNSPAEENGEILQYGIYENNGESLITKVSGNVHNTPVSLVPCVSVGISVRALNNAGWGEQSEVKQVTVVDDVLPKELRCPDPDPEVQVCWKPFSTTCPVSQYNLKWEGDVLWSDTADSNTTTLEWSEDEICYNISSTPYTNYSVELSVGTKLDQTIQCSSTTPMAAPGPPTLEELQTDNLSIKVNWREPEEKNGVIINYLVEWTDWNGVDSFKSTDGNTFSSQIIELSCGGKVDVTVRAKTVEFGEKSLTQSVFIVNSISNLKCEPKKSGVIALSWDVNDSDCLIHRYNVTWNFESLWSDDKGSGWQSVDGNELSALLELLPPYSTVSVEVHVDKSAEETSCFATTLQEAPGPPSLEELQYENFAITVTWKEPEEKNGVITAYEVEWMEANGEEKTHETNGNTFSYQILDPSCGGEVVVTVRAKTVYFGKKSPPRSVVLVNSIMILTCESTDPGVIALDWEIQDKQCPIDSYNVTWSFESLWSDDKGSNWTSIDGNESSVRLTSLPAYSSVSVEFFYSYTQENARCTSITHEETSSIPTLLQQVAKDIYTVSVEWSSPEYLRGKLVGWYLNWTSAIGHYVGEYVIGNPKDLTFEIGSLEPSEVYFVYVMAVNGAGRGEAAVVEASTEYVP